MADRTFTLEEASTALEQVRPLAERMVEHRRALSAAMDRQSERAAGIAGNGGGAAARALARLREEVEREAREVAACIEAITELGVQVKDLDLGLVDFPARRGEEIVLLCWHVGEEEIAFWHREDEGFAGRRPLPL